METSGPLLRNWQRYDLNLLARRWRVGKSRSEEKILKRWKVSYVVSKISLENQCWEWLLDGLSLFSIEDRGFGEGAVDHSGGTAHTCIYGPRTMTESRIAESDRSEQLHFTLCSGWSIITMLGDVTYSTERWKIYARWTLRHATRTNHRDAHTSQKLPNVQYSPALTLALDHELIGVEMHGHTWADFY